MDTMVPEQVDVLVVTALQLERRAVRQHVTGLAVDQRAGLAADVGTSSSNPDLNIAVIETGPGNVNAAVLTSRAEDAFRPSLVVMLGVAGGIKDVRIGDVVVSSKVYWIEGGKQEEHFKARPDFAPVSPKLVLLARAVAADGTWLEGGRGHAGPWAANGRDPSAFVAPIVVSEKVLAARRSELVRLVKQTYGDALAVDMEDFGALSAAGSTERAKVIAVRGVSDLLEKKARADDEGSQPLAAANAAAFLFDLLARLGPSVTAPEPTAIAASPGESHLTVDALVHTGRALYPEGPQQEGLWERAGGDLSRLAASGTGAARWWQAIRLLEHGGGGTGISVARLVGVMRDDYPDHDALREP